MRTVHLAFLSLQQEQPVIENKMISISSKNDRITMKQTLPNEPLPRTLRKLKSLSLYDFVSDVIGIELSLSSG